MVGVIRDFAVLSMETPVHGSATVTVVHTPAAVEGEGKVIALHGSVI